MSTIPAPLRQAVADREVARASRSGFENNPDRDGLATIKAFDPCMGRGHFVVVLFERLVALRLAEEKLDEAAAVAAVLGSFINPRGGEEWGSVFDYSELSSLGAFLLNRHSRFKVSMAVAIKNGRE
jgi:hypothetical protein